MANRTLEITISAKDVFSKTFTKAQSMSRKMGQAIGRNIKRGAIIAAAALGTLAFAMVKATRAANVQEDAEKSLTVALGKRSQALLDQASALQKVTIFGDETIIKAQALIAAFVKDEEQIKAATKATLDLAAAKGFDLVTAADLVSKTLGSSTNALTRYGIEVKGAVGSTERLASLTENINKVFGGQAAAQAQTFSGAIAQMSNTFGDLLEELGFVITKNSFVIKAIGVLRDTFAGLAGNVKDNRNEFIELTKRGVVAMVNGIGSAVEVLRFFENGWLGVKLVANTAIVFISDAVRGLFEGLRLLLTPLDLIFDGLVKLGRIEANPFNGIEKSLGQFQESSRDVLSETLIEIDTVNNRYDQWGNTIDGLATKLEGIAAKQIKLAETASIIPPIAEATTQAAQIAVPATREELTGEMEAQDELSKIARQAELDQIRLEQLALFHQQELEMATAHGASLTDIASITAKQQQELDKATNNARLKTAASTAGALANLAQNLNTALGGENQKAFKAMKGFAISEALINTYQGATKALAQGGIFGFVAAASVIASGLAQVQNIRSQNPSGGGGGGSISAGGAALPTRTGGGTTAQGVPVRLQEEPEKKQEINITFQADGIIAKDTLAQMTEDIIDVINKGGENNLLINASAVAT